MAYGPGQIRWTLTRDTSSAWSQRLRARVQTEMKDSANRVLTDAQERCPVRTGELKASGKIEETGEMSYRVSFGAELPDARAVYQELGTTHHPAQPYLGPAYQGELANLMRRMAITTQGRVRIDPGGLGGTDIELGGTGGLEVSMGE